MSIHRELGRACPPTLGSDCQIRTPLPAHARFGLLNPKHSAGECLRGIYQSPASLKGMSAHARFGLPNPNPFARSRSVRIAKSEPSAGECLRGFANPPRALEGYVRSRSVRIAKSEHSAGERLRGFANPPRAWKGLAEHERL
ncbi:hypothetical protein QUF72_09540 [Desulfobacterales bacterium HSG2]|nr:hypothetical protein [Desulfobacterales bacterium HSG2]